RAEHSRVVRDERERFEALECRVEGSGIASDAFEVSRGIRSLQRAVFGEDREGDEGGAVDAPEGELDRLWLEQRVGEIEEVPDARAAHRSRSEQFGELGVGERSEIPGQ